MFEQQDQEDDSDDDDEDAMNVDGEEDSDIEVLDGQEGGTDIEVDGNSEDEDDERAIDFENKLAEALGTRRGDKDLGEQSSSEDSDADMKDEEMEKIDEQLVKVFQARRKELSKKNERKDAKESMINFKNRVLDLLEIYVKKCYGKALALNILLPLLRLTRRSSEQQISNKANSVLREYCKLCKGTSVPKLDPSERDQVWQLLRDIHEEARRSGPSIHASGCSQASLLVVKVLVASDKEAIGGVVDMYAETRKEQLTSSKCHVQPAFFTDWNNWCVNSKKQIRG